MTIAPVCLYVAIVVTSSGVVLLPQSVRYIGYLMRCDVVGGGPTGSNNSATVRSNYSVVVVVVVDRKHEKSHVQIKSEMGGRDGVGPNDG